MTLSQFSHPDYCIIQFSKSPASPQVKTRLSPQLTLRQRHRLHHAMTRYICETAVTAKLCSVRLWVGGNLHHPDLAALSRDLKIPRYQQQGRDLGTRMYHAAEQTLADFSGVLIIGSDCPFIDATYLQQAILTLADKDAVLGPATDGGYVLLGLRRLALDLFQGMPWGEETVLFETKARFDKMGWSYRLLPAQEDIDRPEDLGLLASRDLPDSLRQFSNPRLLD